MSILKNFGVERFETKLSNGTRVILFHKPNSPIITRALIKSGSMSDPVEIPGLTHFIEHMMLNGSKNFPSKDLLSENIESVGGVMGGRTAKDLMCINIEVAEKADFIKTVETLKAVLCEPLLDRESFENEKKVILKEIESCNSEPNRILSNTVDKLFFRNTEIEHPILGDKDSIVNLDYDRFLLEFRKQINKNNITIVIAGDIGIDEAVIQLETLTFPDFESDKSAGNFVEKLPENEKSEKTLIQYWDSESVRLYLGVISPIPFTKDWVIVKLIENLLVGSRASILFKRLRYEKGLVYSINSAGFGAYDLCCTGFKTETNLENLNTVIKVIIDEISVIQKDGFSQKDLEFIKNKTIKSLARKLETASDFLDFHQKAEIFSDGKYWLDFYVQCIEKIQLNDFNTVFNKYFAKEKFRLAVCGKIDNGIVDFK